MMARRDAWTNLPRATVALFSAALGGADVLTALPFTQAIGLPDAFARRLAINAQHLLIEEANLWRIADPAAGSGGFEALTAALCDAAWTQFQAIEAEGGLAASLAAGAVQARVSEARAARARETAEGRAPIVGVSAFVDPGETPVAVLAARPEPPVGPPQALAPMRDAEPFERGAETPPAA